MKITYYGHATLCLETAGKKLIFDPFISGNPLAKHIDLATLAADYILLTHAHEDHVLDVERLVEQTGAPLISNAEIIGHYEKKGYRGHGMNYGGCLHFDFGLLKYVIALHSSSFADGTYGGNPGGFVLESEGKTLYIAGDTALSQEMKTLGEQHDLELSILPIGDAFTMGYQDAITASQWLDCPRVLGYHYDTFDCIKIDHQRAKSAFEANGRELILLPIGGQLEL